MRFWMQAAGLIVLAVVCAVISNAAAEPERKLKWVGAYADTTPPAAPAAKAATPQAAAPAGNGPAFPPHPDKPWVEISGDDVAALHQRGDVPFLDARRTSVYRDGHVSGARPFSVWESDIDEKVKAFFDEGHDSSGVIVVYCSGGDCEDSHTLAQKLYMAGFDDVLVYKDGFPDWEKRRLPATKGDKP